MDRPARRFRLITPFGDSVNPFDLLVTAQDFAREPLSVPGVLSGST